MLRLENITAGYEKGIPIIEDIHLHIAPGEAVAISGRNGSGKSTLIRAIANLTPFRSGSITLAGNDISYKKTHELRQTGLVFFLQGGRLFETLTAHEHRRLANVASITAMHGDDNRNASFYSGGQRNILAFDLCLSMQPKMLILDEPFAGLQKNMIDQTIAKLQTFLAKGNGILIIEHLTKHTDIFTRKYQLINKKLNAQ